MRAIRLFVITAVAASSLMAAKKVVSPTTTAANEQVDLEATITTAPEEVVQKLGADPGKGVVLLRVRFTPKVDTPVTVSRDDFILLAHDDGERARPFSPAELAGAGALVETTKTAAGKKTSMSGGVGPMIGMGGGGISSPGNSLPVAVNTKMDDKAAGNQQLMNTLKTKELPQTDTTKPVEGFLYFPLDKKHKLKNLTVMYRGPAGKLDLDFVH
jgi:hypothetical protein